MVGRDRAVHDFLQASGGEGIGIDAGEAPYSLVVLLPVSFAHFSLSAAPDPNRIQGVEIGRVAVFDLVCEVAALAFPFFADNDFPCERFPLLACTPHSTLDMVLGEGWNCAQYEYGRYESQFFQHSPNHKDTTLQLVCQTAVFLFSRKTAYSPIRISLDSNSSLGQAAALRSLTR